VLIIEEVEGILTIKIILAFSVGLAIIYLTALLVGTDNKGKWFRKRRKVSIFNRRGMLGESCHFGYPCTWQGLFVTIAMYSIIGLFGYGIIVKL